MLHFRVQKLYKVTVSKKINFQNKKTNFFNNTIKKSTKELLI